MIEDLARTAVDDLRSTTTTDVETGLLDLYAAHRRHRRHTAWAAAASVVVALGVGWWGGHTLAADPAPAPPQPIGTPPATRLQTCTGLTRCLGDSTYRYGLTQPVTWHIPYGYGAGSGGGPSRWMVESYALRSSDTGGGPYQYDSVAGVTVQEGVRAASADGGSARAGVADAPQAFISWLASRPYLSASAVVPTHLDGRPAWRVRVTLKHGADNAQALCNASDLCFAVTYTPDGTVTGIWGDMVADYTAFRVPGAGTTVVWSWAFGHERSALARNRVAVDGLSWPRR